MKLVPKPPWRPRVGVAVALLVAAGGLLALRGRQEGASRSVYESAAVDRGAVVARVTASGTLSALRTPGFRRISERAADFNTRVTRWHAVARANVLKARTRAADAEAQAARAKHLADRRFLSAQERETMKAETRRGRAPRSLLRMARSCRRAQRSIRPTSTSG